jgi:hypothetical protein
MSVLMIPTSDDAGRPIFFRALRTVRQEMSETASPRSEYGGLGGFHVS